MPPKPPRDLTEDQIDEIVRLRLNAVPVRQVAAEVGCNKDTVTKWFNRWLDETSVERRTQLDREQSRVITRLVSLADDARRQTVRVRADLTAEPAARWTAEARFMQAERSALRDLSTVAGFDAPKRIEMAAAVTMTEAEALAILGDDA